MEIVCAPETYRRFESSSLRHENAPTKGCVFLWRREEIEGGFVFSEVRASDAVLTSLIKPQSCHSGATLCCHWQQISSSLRIFPIFFFFYKKILTRPFCI